MRFALALLFALALPLVFSHGFDDDMSPILAPPSSARFRASVASAVDVVLVPSTTEGPYAATIADYANNADLTASAKAGSSGVTTERTAVTNGVPVTLTIKVYNVSGDTGTEINGATVYIWHTDAIGVYSAVNLATASSNREDTQNQKWCRSYQVTDATGAVTFKTILPGWYSGRTMHYHIRVHVPGVADTTYAATTQFFFPDSMQTMLKGISPYSSRASDSYTTLASDGIYTGVSSSLRDKMVLNLAGSSTAGYTATFNLGVQIDSSGASTSSTSGNTSGGTQPSSGGGTRPSGTPPSGTPGTAPATATATATATAAATSATPTASASAGTTSSSSDNTSTLSGTNSTASTKESDDQLSTTTASSSSVAPVSPSMICAILVFIFASLML